MSFILNGIRKTPTRKILTWNIPTHVFKYSHRGFSNFVFSLLIVLLPLSLLLLFCNSMFVVLKPDLLRCIKKILACPPKWLHTQKSFAGQV